MRAIHAAIDGDGAAAIAHSYAACLAAGAHSLAGGNRGSGKAVDRSAGATVAATSGPFVDKKDGIIGHTTGYTAATAARAAAIFSCSCSVS